jgi:hypothetical protein
LVAHQSYELAEGFGLRAERDRNRCSPLLCAPFAAAVSRTNLAHVEVSLRRAFAALLSRARSASVRRMRKMFSRTSLSGFFGRPIMSAM